MKEITYSNSSLYLNKYKPFLFLVKGGELYLFSGIAISGVLSVKDRKNFQSKKTIYTLSINNGVVVVEGLQDVNTNCIIDSLKKTFQKEIVKWNDLATALNVSGYNIREFFCKHWPITAGKIDDNDDVTSKPVSRVNE